eukprot:jgi/Bigna1/69052/fgenesh1_pg.7_\
MSQSSPPPHPNVENGRFVHKPFHKGIFSRHNVTRRQSPPFQQEEGTNSSDTTTTTTRTMTPTAVTPTAISPLNVIRQPDGTLKFLELDRCDNGFGDEEKEKEFSEIQGEHEAVPMEVDVPKGGSLSSAPPLPQSPPNQPRGEGNLSSVSLPSPNDAMFQAFHSFSSSIMHGADDKEAASRRRSRSTSPEPFTITSSFPRGVGETRCSTHPPQQRQRQRQQQQQQQQLFSQHHPRMGGGCFIAAATTMQRRNQSHRDIGSSTNGSSIADEQQLHRNDTQQQILEPIGAIDYHICAGRRIVLGVIELSSEATLQESGYSPKDIVLFLLEQIAESKFLRIESIGTLLELTPINGLSARDLVNTFELFARRYHWRIERRTPRTDLLLLNDNHPVVDGDLCSSITAGEMREDEEGGEGIPWSYINLSPMPSSHHHGSARISSSSSHDGLERLVPLPDRGTHIHIRSEQSLGGAKAEYTTFSTTIANGVPKTRAILIATHQHKGGTLYADLYETNAGGESGPLMMAEVVSKCN